MQKKSEPSTWKLDKGLALETKSWKWLAGPRIFAELAWGAWSNLACAVLEKRALWAGSRTFGKQEESVMMEHELILRSVCYP